MQLSNRRNFLKLGFLSSAVFVMSGCDLFGVTTSAKTITILQNDLFPKATELGIKTASYMKIILNHSRIKSNQKEYIKNGVKWLNEEAVEMYDKSYEQLPASKRQLVLKQFSSKEWGEPWLETMMGYLFEAMLGDPLYGSNQNEAGWKWLAFEGGQPRPKEMYL